MSQIAKSTTILLKACLTAAPLLTACSEMDMGAWDSATEGVADSGPYDENYDDTGETGELRVPSWWLLEAELLVEDQAAVVGDAQVTSSLLDELADSADSICSMTQAVASITEEKSPDEMIFHWWDLTLAGGEGTCNAAQADHLPQQLHLGLGQLHADIAALLEPTGYEGMDEHLYGAYVQLLGEEDIWAFGIAATGAGFDADQEAVDEAPIPNGTYQVVPVYLLPLQGG